MRRRRLLGRLALGGGLIVAGVLAATAAGQDSIAGRQLPKPSGDVPAPLAEAELCAALISADARDAASRALKGGDPGADFALRGDQVRLEWALRKLGEADPRRDWRARVEALAARTPTDVSESGYPATARAYVACLERQNREPDLTAALHAAFGYEDLP